MGGKSFHNICFGGEFEGGRLVCNILILKDFTPPLPPPLNQGRG